MAAATVTLSTTTTTARVGSGDSQVILASLTGVAPGSFLWMDAELMRVQALTGVGNAVIVRRGVEGSASGVHANGVTVTIGRGDQFYASDPVGVPPSPPLVLPYINVVNGTVWQPVGDEVGPGTDARFWQKQIVAPGSGAFGVQVNTTQGEI